MPIVQGKVTAKDDPERYMVREHPIARPTQIKADPTGRCMGT